MMGALVLQVTLEDLQLGRSLLHRQAEAAIKEADGQIKLNQGQYDHAGRLLVHAKAGTQCLSGHMCSSCHLSAQPTCVYKPCRYRQWQCLQQML